MTRTLTLAAASAALITGIFTTAHADDEIGLRALLPGILAADLHHRHGAPLYRIDDDDDDGWRTRGAVVGRVWHDDDDDDGRDRWDDDDDDDDGRRGRWRNDDDD